MERKDKIEALKAVLQGKKTVDELVEQKDYIWHKMGEDEPYLLSNPDKGETKTVFTDEEFKDYMNSKHPKHRAVVFTLQEGYDPLNEPITD